MNYQKRVVIEAQFIRRRKQLLGEGFSSREGLVSQEGDGGIADFGKFAELVAAMGDEIGCDFFVFLEGLFPS